VKQKGTSPGNVPFFIVFLPGCTGISDMTTQIKHIIDTLDRIAPFRLAESWDNSGLLVGDPDRETAAVLVGLDPTGRLLDEAISRGANTIVTHHPLIFRPLSAINTATPIGLFLEKALTNRINIIACHTNLDSARKGVNDTLADLLGLIDVEPLSASADGTSPGTGIGRIGNLKEVLDPIRFMERVFSALDVPSVQVAGRLPDRIGRVALCGGSGSDFAVSAFAGGADVYLSAEIKHSMARWAEECNFCIIDGSHYATEQPVVRHLVAQLQIAADAQNWNIPILQTLTETHPFVIQNRRSLQENHTHLQTGEQP
jgi:dinuclear metal center YbgI/SA1388 family protein